MGRLRDRDQSQQRLVERAPIAGLPGEGDRLRAARARGLRVVQAQLQRLAGHDSCAGRVVGDDLDRPVEQPVGLLGAGPRQRRPARSSSADDLQDQVVVVGRERDRRRLLHVLLPTGIADELLRLREPGQPGPPL